MSSRLVAMTWRALEPRRLGDFWVGLLQWDDVAGGGDVVELRPADDTGFDLRFMATDEAKRSQNRMHYDLLVDPAVEREGELARLVSLGATLVSRGAGPDPDVLQDSDGNEFWLWHSR
jgi:hypothetical protein